MEQTQLDEDVANQYDVAAYAAGKGPSFKVHTMYPADHACHIHFTALQSKKLKKKIVKDEEFIAKESKLQKRVTDPGVL